MGKKIVYFITGEDDTGIKLALENTNDYVTICLLQNAVYFGNKITKEISEAINQNKIVIACKEDVVVRGIKNLIFDQIKLQNYSEIIDTVILNDAIINM